VERRTRWRERRRNERETYERTRRSRSKNAKAPVAPALFALLHFLLFFLFSKPHPAITAMSLLSSALYKEAGLSGLFRAQASSGSCR